VAWAVLLVALGTIFLLNTVFGIRLPVRQMLPAALVLLGAYMLFDYLRRGGRRGRELTFDNLSPAPTFGGTPLDMTRFRTGDLATQTSSRRIDTFPPRL
jgi:hypothetical protein